MKLSTGFWQTYKEVPADAEIPSHQLMIRSGMIMKAAAGLYYFLPMGIRVNQKIEKIVREELDRINCFEILPPFITPGELWKESGRWEKMGPEMLRAKDRLGRDICLSPTNEEAFTDVFRKTIKSYKQLPLTLYQINTKFRDEIRPRYGLMRCREFIMKDAYSFHDSNECLDKVYHDIYLAYEKIFKRMGLKYIVVEADGGKMAAAGARTHEFQVLAGSGEDRVLKCSKCDYAANIERAVSRKIKSLSRSATEKKLIEHSTPNKETIDDVSVFLNISKEQCLKSLVYTAVYDNTEKHFMIIVAGDDSLNEIKLNNFLKADHFFISKDQTLNELNLVKGFIGPKVSDKYEVIIDSEVDLEAEYCVGASKKDFHLLGFVPKIQLNKYQVADLREARAGDLCSQCNELMVEVRGIEVGHIFQLGDLYTKSMKVSILNKEGKSQTPLMGCYGLGVTRTAAAAIEQNHDEKGIIWPASIAPYQCYFAVISKDEKFLKFAEDIYLSLTHKGIETIFDDRNVGPGFKFKDADLLGIPIRLVLGERDYGVDQKLEIVIRKTGESMKVSKDEVLAKIEQLLKEL
jgi:prolyl-tRNA synthetase